MMRHFSIRLAVALVTFVVGLKLAWAFAALFGPALTREEVKAVSAPVVKVRSCPTTSRVLDVPPPPPPPAPPAAAEGSKRTRVVIRHPDGTEQVIETRRAPRAKDKF